MTGAAAPRQTVPPPSDAAPQVARGQRIALVDLLDRVLGSGVVVVGEVRLSIADVDLVTISLRALISSVSTAFGAGPGDRDTPP